MSRRRPLACFSFVLFDLAAAATGAPAMEMPAGPVADLRELERQVMQVIEKTAPAFVFIEGCSGFLVSADGLILTNEHVVAGKQELTVQLVGGRQLQADVLGHDPGGDLALLKLRDSSGVPALELGDSDALRVGEPVIALGDPFLLGSSSIFLGAAPASYEPSASLGVVSALHRFSDTYFDAVQVDVAVNRGNSGGPLLNLAGKVVGINGKIETRFETGINTGVGYAIPANQIRRFFEPLKGAEGGRVNHGTILFDDRLSALKRRYLTRKEIDVRFAEALHDGFSLDGVAVLKVGTYGVKLQLDTRERPIDAVIQRLMADRAVVDINVADPPLEEIIARIYQEPNKAEVRE